MKVKKLLLTMCLFILGVVMTGCGEALTTDVKITSATKANCTIQVGFDDELLSAIAEMSGTTTKDLIKEMKASGATYSKKKLNGVKYHMFSTSIKNAKLSDVEALLEESGYIDVCITKNYFYATFDPDALSNGLASSIAGLADKAAEIQAENDMPELSFYMKTTVSMKSKIKATNGKLSNGSKKATWTIKDASKKKTLYASTSKVKKTAKTTSVKNGKTYKPGKKIAVTNSSSLVKMELDGKTVKKNTVVTKKGKHTLTIWSRNGKVQNVNFKIK